MFFANWAIEYHFPVKAVAGLILLGGIILVFLKMPKIGATAVISAALVWCCMDMITDYIRFNNLADVSGLAKVQALGGVWAVVIAIAAVGVRFMFADTRWDAITIIGIVVLVGLMIFQVAHEMSTGPDLTASIASYAQQLLPAAMWAQLAVTHWYKWQ